MHRLAGTVGVPAGAVAVLAVHRAIRGRLERQLINGRTAVGAGQAHGRNVDEGLGLVSTVLFERHVFFVFRPSNARPYGSRIARFGYFVNSV